MTERRNKISDVEINSPNITESPNGTESSMEKRLLDAQTVRKLKSLLRRRLEALVADNKQMYLHSDVGYQSAVERGSRTQQQR